MDEEPRFEICFPCIVPRGWSMPRHRHGEHELCVVLSGGFATLGAEGEEVVAGPGDLLFHPARQMHRPRNPAPQRSHLIHVRWWGPAPGLGTLVRRLDDRAGRGRMLLAWLLELMPADGGQAAAQPLLLALLAHLAACVVEPGVRLADQVRRLFLDDPSARWSLEDLACRCHYSRYHFARRFREQTGLSPMRFLRDERLAMARRLLCETNLSATAVADAVGLVDASHLGRLLRATTGQGVTGLRRQAGTPAT
jgi:AraC-like DNA-binding protein/mannose-6-phosphate isomerase-like protein (cupin superfamily)